MDWAVASRRHLAMVSPRAILAYELALTAGDVGHRAVLRLNRVDACYGAIAADVLTAGVERGFGS